MRLFYKIIQLVILAVIIFMFSCEKKRPWPVIPGTGSCLTEARSLPFYDSLNYGTSVTEFGIPPGWVEEIVPGSKTDRGWAYRATYGLTGAPSVYDGCILASAFGGNPGVDNTYLIIGPFNLAQYDSAQLAFDYRVEYSGAGTITFKYSTDYPGCGNPESQTSWNPLTGINSILPTSATQGYVNISDNFVLKDDHVFIGVHFNGGLPSGSPRYRIDNFRLIGF